MMQWVALAMFAAGAGLVLAAALRMVVLIRRYERGRNGES